MKPVLREVLDAIIWCAILGALVAMCVLGRPASAEVELVYEAKAPGCTEYRIPMLPGPGPFPAMTCVVRTDPAAPAPEQVLGCASGPDPTDPQLRWIVTVAVALSGDQTARVRGFAYSTTDLATALRSPQSEDYGTLRMGATCQVPGRPTLLPGP